MTAPVAVLFARADSIYKALPGADVWDSARDARTWPGGCPVVAHPPCRAWGRLRKLANPEPVEYLLALWAVQQVRRFGGVLEHPAGSLLWAAAGLPAPGKGRDVDGGWTFPVSQVSWGHRANKATWLYIVGCGPDLLPDMPGLCPPATAICGSPGRRRDGTRLHKGDDGWRPEISKREREATPPAFAAWLLEVARRCHRG